MPTRRPYYDSSSSESSFQSQSIGSKRKLPTAPTGILRNAATNRHVTIVDPTTITRRVDIIADHLEDTSRNLKNVDSKLSDFKDLHDDSMSALTKLQEDLESSLHRLRNTRERRSVNREPGSLHCSDLNYCRSASLTRNGRIGSPGSRDYESDITDYHPGLSNRRPSSSLGFSRYRHGDGHSSSIHDKVHDLSSNQTKLQEELNDEIFRRKKSEKTLRDMSEASQTRNAADRVEKRLKEIERGFVADRNNATQLACDVATDILKRTQSKLQEDDVSNRNRLMQVEAGKRAIESELEATRRRLEQSEGGKEALLSQIGELRTLINRSDKERAELQRRIEQHEIQERLKLEKASEEKEKLAASQKYDRERMRQETEIEDLRAALKRSAGVVQLDEMRRELEKSERQRQQLSDHIEVLSKDLEKKEQGNARILNQHHDLQRAFDQSERDKERVYGQLEDALKKIKELTRDAEKTGSNLNKLEEARQMCEKEKEEMRCAAQDTIRQWKTKCRKQEKEIDRLNENFQQINLKNEEILKESIAGKAQTNNAYQQIEKLRNEMDDLIAKRAEADEKICRREDEVEQIAEEKRILIKQMKDGMVATENLEIKLKETFDKLTLSNQKFSKSDKEVESLTSLYNTSKKQIAQLQHELRELKIRFNELESQLSSEKRERSTVERSSEDASKQVQAMRIELSAVHKQLEIERDTHKKELKQLHTEIHAGEVQRMDVVQKVSKKADEERIFLEGEIHRINVEANEAKANTRDLHKQLLKAKDKLNSLEAEAKGLDHETKSWKEKYHSVKSTLENKCADLSREGARIQRLEDDLLWSRDQLHRLEQLIELVNDALSEDIGELELMLELNSINGSLRESFSESIEKKGSMRGDSWIVIIRKKLDRIKREVRAKIEQRKQAIEDLKDQKKRTQEMCRALEEERRKLMSEVTEQNKLVDCLSKEKTSLILENKEARLIVHDLEDRVTNLTTDLENSKVRFLHGKLTEISNIKPISVEESKKERERIQERYAKYKGTMDSLQAELEESRNRVRFREREENSPSPSKRVTVIDRSSTINGYSPIRPHSSSPKYVPERDSSYRHFK